MPRYEAMENVDHVHIRLLLLFFDWIREQRVLSLNEIEVLSVVLIVTVKQMQNSYVHIQGY